MPRKVIVKKWVVICNVCNHREELDDLDPCKEEEKTGGYAKSASISIFCPKCAYPKPSNFRIFFEYHQYYRIRCKDCNEMFNATHSHEVRCPECDHEYLKAMSRLGAY